MPEFKYYVNKIEKPSPDVIVFDLEDGEGRPVFDFKPGQFVMITYRKGKGGVELRHSFSLASAPGERNAIRLGIKVIGNFTQGLAAIKEGDAVFVSGPYGKFVFDEKRHQQLVMIAGGIGVTPFLSTIRHASIEGLTNELKLLYSARSLQDLVFYKEIKSLAERNRHFAPYFFISDQKISSGAGMINRRIGREDIRAIVGDMKGKAFFVCGPEKFTAAMIDNLLGLGVERSRIETEEFSMIPDKGVWLPIRNTIYAAAFSLAIFSFAFHYIDADTNAASQNKASLPASGGQGDADVSDLAVPPQSAANNDANAVAPSPDAVQGAIGIGASQRPLMDTAMANQQPASRKTSAGKADAGKHAEAASRISPPKPTPGSPAPAASQPSVQAAAPDPASQTANQTADQAPAQSTTDAAAQTQTDPNAGMMQQGMMNGRTGMS